MDSMTDHRNQEEAKLELQVISEYELATITELSQVEEGHGSSADYVLCSVEELRALLSEVGRLRKEVDYLREALHFEERQTVRFRREHDCY